MYHSNGNYEAFVHPSKPEGIENESAYIVSTGLAGLSAAIFLVRDAQVPGENIHILESSPIAGGALDGAYIEGYGYCCRGGRELEDHMECLWDMFRSVPSLENPGMSVLDETYYLNKDDPNYSLERAIYSGGKSATTFDLSFSPRVNQQMQVLMMTPESELDDKPISDFFDDEFFSTPYGLYWSTMFAFQKWHSALEFKRYCLRFIVLWAAARPAPVVSSRCRIPAGASASVLTAILAGVAQGLQPLWGQCYGRKDTSGMT